MTEQLKPCPFCGGAAHFFKITDLDEKNFGGEGICCGSCPITTDLMFSLMEDCKPKLAEAWNRRVQPAQAVPVLSDEEIVYQTDEIPLGDGCFIKVARAVEQAVRAKMGAAVPMTDEQAKDIAQQEIRGPDALAMEASLIRVIRHAERHHGIVGKEGA